jgi:membrane protease YdiL (CAAX protease family)
MPALRVVVAVGGPVAVTVAWGLVRARRASVWAAMGVTFVALGTLSLAVGGFAASERFHVSVAAGVGVVAGTVLYGATVAFLAVAGRWPSLARHTAALYGAREDVSPGVALMVAALVTAPGEELLWRGVVLGTLGRAFDSTTAAAVLAWAAYVAVNAVSASVPIVLGAIVGGAAWTALAWWTGGVVAGIVCHVVWTALMILRPPAAARP